MLAFLHNLSNAFFHIHSDIKVAAYLFWTGDVASICQDKAAELVKVLHSPLFPLWGLQKRENSLCVRE